MNFIKGYLGIWLQMLLVIVLGVMFSTFLSGPVAMLATIGALLGGFFNDYHVSGWPPTKPTAADRSNRSSACSRSKTDLADGTRPADHRRPDARSGGRTGDSGGCR